MRQMGIDPAKEPESEYKGQGRKPTILSRTASAGKGAGSS